MAPLGPKHQPRSWFGEDHASWPESKVPATHKHNLPKWKGLGLVCSWTPAGHTLPGARLLEKLSPAPTAGNSAGPRPLAAPPLTLRAPCSGREGACGARWLAASPALPRCHWLPGPLCSRSQPQPNRAAEVRGRGVSGCGVGPRVSPRSGDRGRGTEPLRRPAWTWKPKWRRWVARWLHLGAGAAPGSRVRYSRCRAGTTPRTPNPGAAVAVGRDPDTRCQRARNSGKPFGHAFPKGQGEVWAMASDTASCLGKLLSGGSAMWLWQPGPPPPEPGCPGLSKVAAD